jgi:hypothetical protein
MPSHDVSVLAGEVGSSKRTKKINNMLDVIDKRVAEARNEENKGIIVSAGDLATELNWSQSTICRNGFPEFFTKYYDSTQWSNSKGLKILAEEWVEERKEQREKLAELNEEDE